MTLRSVAEPDEAEALERAWFLYERKRYEQALTECMRALAAEPGSAAALELAAWALIGLGRWSEVEVFAGQCLAAAPEGDAGHLLLALVEDHRERYESAHEQILRAIAAAPENARHRAVLGCILARWGRIEDGITAARQALVLQPGSGLALGTLASLYRINAEPELAARYAAQALEAEPDAAHHHLEEGMRLLERRDAGRARLRFLEALRLDPARGDTFEAIAHETVRTHWAFKHAVFPPQQRALAIAALLVPAIWYGLSLLWRPLIALAWLCSALLAAGYSYRGAFVLCRRAVLARLRRGRL